MDSAADIYCMHPFSESEIASRARGGGSPGQVGCEFLFLFLFFARSRHRLMRRIFTQKLQELIRRGTPRDLVAAQELMKDLSGSVRPLPIGHYRPSLVER